MLTPHQQDLLRAAFGGGESAATSWRRWRERVNWDAHLDRDSFRLMPRTSRNLKELGVEDPLLPRLIGIARQAWYANQRVVKRWQPMFQALEAAQVEPLLVPPAALFLLDARSVLNANAPITLGVRLDDAEGAIRCLLDARWRTSVQILRWSLTGHVTAGQGLSLWNAEGQVVNLIWQPDRSDSLGRLPGDVWERTSPARLANVAVCTLDAADAVHDHCRQPFTGHPFSHVVDLLLIIDAVTGAIDWARLSARAVRAPLAPEWRDGLAELRMVLPEWFAPSQLVSWTESAPSTAVHSRGGLRARMEGHWAAYRAALGAQVSATTAIRQLPGYLLARWNLPAWHQIPMRFFRGLRWEWRDTRVSGK